MKKISKLLVSTFLVFTLAIGLVGMTTTNASAANYVTNKKITIKLDMPLYWNIKYTATMGSLSYTSPRGGDVYGTGYVTLPTSSSIASVKVTYKDPFCGDAKYVTVKVSKNNMNKTIVVKPKIATGGFVTGLYQVTLP